MRIGAHQTGYFDAIERQRLDFSLDLAKSFFCHRVKGDPCIFLVLPFGERISDLKHLCSVYDFAPIPLLSIGDLRGVLNILYPPWERLSYKSLSIFCVFVLELERVLLL